jgi:K+-sensing histidine kinase KdpD
MTSNARPYVAACVLVAAAAAIGGLALQVLQVANLSILFVLAILIVSVYWGLRPGLFAALLSALVFDFCFVPPYYTFAFTDLPYVVTASGFLVVAIATGVLSSRARALTLAQEARARAEASAQAKDEILNQISHELRSPLSAILGWTQFLRDTPHGPPASTRALLGLERSAQLINRLVDDLLTTARINSGKLAVVRRSTALGPIVTLVTDLMRAQAAAHDLTLDVEVSGDRPVMADPHRIEQIVRNLLSNAMKFTPSGGSIRVSLEADGGLVRLIVRDTGIGIRPDFLPRIFEQFSQADHDNVRQGLGLGLSIVHYLVSAHDGTITVDSAGEGYGTTVTVEFPCVPGAPPVRAVRAVVMA